MSLALLAGTVTNADSVIGSFKDLNPFSISEKGSGMTQSNTLEHAIDKLDKANDFEAIKTADIVRDRIARGETNVSSLFGVIARELGYPQDGGIQRSRKGPYIEQMINKEIQEASYEEVARERNMLSKVTLAGAGSKAGGLDWKQWVLISVLGGMVFFNLQAGRK